MPKWLQVMANCPDTMVEFFGLFKSVMDDRPLPAKLKWKVAYVVSELNKCEFCVDATASKMKQMGISEEELAKVNEPEDQREKLAVEYAKATTEHAYKLDPEMLEAIKSEFSDEEIVELTAVVGTFNFINRFNDALRVLPEVE